jgi:hypothetical protein
MPEFTEWGDDLADALAAPFPDAVVKTKRKGSTNISFVSWHIYAARLNQLVGPNGWSASIADRAEVGGKLMLAVTVTILGCAQTNVGTEDEDKDDYGDAATNAWAQAFKRACAGHGLGLYMYFKDKPLPPRLNAKEREHVAILEFVSSRGRECPPDLQARIKREWGEAKKAYATAATLCGLVEEATGAVFHPSPVA